MIFQTVESDGIVGLSPNKIGNRGQDLLVLELFNQGKISMKAFSIFIGTTYQTSKLWIGTIVEPTDPTALGWMPLTSSQHWQVGLSSAQVGDTSINLVVSKDAILDTGTSLTYVPSAEFNQIITLITNGRSC
jgi:hypothetical protein